MRIPEIYADFHRLDDQNRIVLDSVGTRRAIAQLQLQLRPGMVVLLHTDDADESGQPDDLMAIGVVQFDNMEKRWVARVNWQRLFHRSQRSESIVLEPLCELLHERDEMILALQAMLDHAAPVDVDAVLANRSENTPMSEFIAELERESSL